MPKNISNFQNRKEKYNFDDAVTFTGYGAYNIYLLFTVGGFLMCVIIETMSMMFIVPAAKCDLNLSLSQQGLLSSISFFGVVASSYIWGFLADTQGRRKVLIISLISSFITSIICSLISYSSLFILLRFLNGACVGGASSITYAYIGEFHNDKLRPKIVSGVAVFVAFGNTYLPGMAWVILPQEWRVNIEFLNLVFRPWRLLLIIYALPSLLFAVLIYLLPESPKFLMTQGKYQEALEILKSMFSINKGMSKDDFVVSEITWEDTGPVKERSFLKTIWKQTAPILKRPLLYKTIGVSILQFGIFASTSGMIMWYPTILNTMSQFTEYKPDEELTLCRSIYWEQDLKTTALQDTVNETTNNFIKECNDVVKTDVFLVSLAIGIIYAFMYIFIGLLINIIGKKNLLCLFLVTATTAGMISQYIVGYQLIQILIAIFVTGGVQVGIVNAVVVDLFPTKVRAMALAMSLMFGRLGAMVGTNAVGPLIYNWCDYIFYIFTANHIVLLIVIYLLPSTRPLEKIVDDSA
ncbi:hypothetical protein WA026_007468 [Henosepilachna vigintioctopunctata]|uniref:Major facilitator superfamily (MFS) profile domain-containing protein n=1 Tax=Henosepilachna vigintioctopunctata TaxID=420089 RepID=A0AAW1UVW7_9CUCU